MSLDPKTREEQYLSAIANGSEVSSVAVTREEKFLQGILNGEPPALKPITRKEMFYKAIAEGGTPGGGSSGGSSGGDGYAYRVRFFVDGSLYDTQWVEHGKSATAPVEPTKENDGRYSYIFSGWDSDYSNITAPKDINAVFTATEQTFIVRWYNGDTLLETDVVPYGSTPVYNGAEPVYNGSGDAADYAFIGWSPAVAAITGDTTYTAEFKFASYYYAKIVDRTISGAYSNDTATALGASALQGCTKLTSVTLRAATSLVDNALFGCTALTMVDLHMVTSIGSNAFCGCNSLTTLILRSKTVCTLANTNAFTNTLIANNKGGRIYVPRDLVSSYKATTGWASFAYAILAIEDYPEITGGES